MIRKAGCRIRYLRILCALAACAALSVSCSGRDRAASFSSKLAEIDRLIESGDADAAAKRLVSLEGKASSASDWFSIVRRQRELDRGEDAAACLRKALLRMPANASLSAVLTDTLLSLGRTDEALQHSASLSGSPYSAVAALAGMRGALSHPFTQADPASFIDAWKTTGHPVFLRDAAVLLALSGKLEEACALSGRGDGTRPVLSGERRFRALLAYDSGHADRVAPLLGFESPATGETPADGKADRAAILIPEDAALDDLLLVADALFISGDLDGARECWTRILAAAGKNAPAAPACYNLSVTETDADRSLAVLKSCLQDFPSYYPAVVRLVRSVPDSGDPEVFDPIEKGLDEAGFRTIEMENDLHAVGVRVADAADVLVAALAASGDSPDTRLLIEELRFEQRRRPDTVRTASLMWRLLEDHPADGLLVRYAVWYFAALGQYDASFSLNDGLGEGKNHFYSGLEAAMAGRLDLAEKEFLWCANDSASAWAALASMGRIRERKKDEDGAVEAYSLAAGMAPAPRTASAILYEAARILAGQKRTERALGVVTHALDLDADNHRARQLERELLSVRQ